MTPQMVSQLVRVRLVRGPTHLHKRVRHLKVRAEVVRLVAQLYIERHENTLKDSPSISALLQKYTNCTVKECLLQHAFDRLAHYYPDEQYPLEPTDEHHGIIKEMQDVVEAESALQAKFGHDLQESAFEMKNATMPDAETDAADAFADKRPLLVLDEGKTDGALPAEAVLKYGLGS